MILPNIFMIVLKSHRFSNAACFALGRESWFKNFTRCKHQLKVEKSPGESPPAVPEKLSTLFVPLRYGGLMYQIVKPVIDSEYLEKTISQICNSCQLREMQQPSGHLLSLIRLWQTQKKYFADLCEKDVELVNELNQAKKTNSCEYDNLQRKYEDHMVSIKSEKEKLLCTEDELMPVLKNIPNIVDPITPAKHDTIGVKIEPKNFNHSILSHIILSKKLDLLEFSNVSPSSYFLSDELSCLELTIQNHCCEELKISNYHPLSCVDFCKSFIIEAVGLDPYSLNDCVIITSKHIKEIGQKLNLVGGASFESFCGYFTNMNIDKATLPTRYFSVGRRYTAGNRVVTPESLFSVVQSTNIHVIGLNIEQDTDDFDVVFSDIQSFYTALALPYRVVDVSARNLNITESRRTRIELWSPASGSYVNVAHVSQRNDFISRRLHVTYGVHHVVEGYCSMVEGVVVNIPVLIGCLVENYQSSSGSIDFDSIFKLFNNALR